MTQLFASLLMVVVVGGGQSRDGTRGTGVSTDFPTIFNMKSSYPETTTTKSMMFHRFRI